MKDRLKNILKTGLVALALSGCGDLKVDLNKKLRSNQMITNNAPTIESTPSLEILVHNGYNYDPLNQIWKYDFNNYQYDVDATDAENDPLTYYLTQFPIGVTIDPITGLIEFPLSFNELGKHNITVVVDDGNSQTEQNFILDVRYPYINEYGNIIAEYAYVRGNDEMVLICEEQCTYNEDFNKKWDGVNLGFNALTTLTGITPNYKLKPIEMHLEEDTRCINKGDPGYFGLIRRNEGYAPSQGMICTFVGNLGIDPASLQDQRTVVHESLHALQAENISSNLPDEFEESQADSIADIVVGDIYDPNDNSIIWYDAIESYCEEKIGYPYQVFHDLCTNCSFDYDKESLFWNIVSTTAYRERLLELTQVFSDITSCSPTDIENIFLENKLYQCSNGKDDNKNGLADLNDPNCIDTTDSSEFLPNKQY